MKNVKAIMISTLLLSQVTFADSNKYDEGENLYKTNCAACHGGMGGMDETKRIAPPIAAVRMHYINTYSDEDSFVQAVAGWVEKQDEEKSMMKGAIRKFKIMPPVNVATEDAEKIAAYIFAGNIEEPKGLKEHVEKKHGKQGKRHGKKHNMN